MHGIELDPEMIDQLRAKPGSEHVRVHHGEMADMDVDGSFDLIYAVVGTLFMLPTQSDQVRCFRRAAQKLTGGGKLVVEALMPRPSGYDDRGSKCPLWTPPIDWSTCNGGAFSPLTRKA